MPSSASHPAFKSHVPGRIRESRLVETDIRKAIGGNAFFEKTKISGSRFEGKHVSAATDNTRSQEAEVPEVGAYVIEDVVGGQLFGKQLYVRRFVLTAQHAAAGYNGKSPPYEGAARNGHCNVCKEIAQ